MVASSNHFFIVVSSYFLKNIIKYMIFKIKGIFSQVSNDSM